MVKHLCTQADRITKIETDSTWIKENMMTVTDKLNKIDEKLDKVIETKVDKKDFETFKTIAISVTGTVLLLLISLVGFLLKRLIFG